MRCGGLASSCNSMKELNANIIYQPQDQNNNYDVRSGGKDKGWKIRSEE